MKRKSYIFDKTSNINLETSISGELYSGNNFEVHKYFSDSLSNLSFNFNSKNDRARDVKFISESTNENYKKTSEQFVEILLGNYQTFMNIGKYVDRIDKNIANLMNSQKNYSILLSNLQKDVEAFSIDYVKYLKDVENEEAKLRENNKKNQLYFEEFDDLEKALEEDFQLEDFLNPQKGTKRWLEEQPEKLRVLIDEKNFNECVKLVKEIRDCELELVDYDTKLEIDNVYNYLIEKLTVSISRCSSHKEIQIYLDHMKNLGCTNLAIDTFLNWLSKKLKIKINKLINQESVQEENNSISNNVILEEDEENVNENNKVIEKSVAKNENPNLEKKIIKIIIEYFTTLDKSTKLMDEYFLLKEKPIYSSYTIPWLKGEIALMTKSIENLFAKVTNFSSLKSIMRQINNIFTNLDNKGSSGKYLYDLHFINNIKISLEAIINNGMKSEGVQFDLKEYEIKHSDKVLKIMCVSELGNAVSNVSLIISDFINEFINQKQKFTGIAFIEEYFFETILAKEFFQFMKNKITKSMTNNLDVKSFSDNESMATTNQILINYGISILSIEGLLEFFLKEMSTNSLISPTSIENLKFIQSEITELKSEYFSKLFKIKIESHFFKFFDTNKNLLSRDLNEDFKEPDRNFVTFYQVIKNLAKSVKTRVNNSKYLSFFIVENQFVNFLKIIDSLRQLDKLYDTEFNFSKLGITGMDCILHGVLFVYYAIQKVLNLDEENKYKIITEKFLDEFVIEFGKVRNISIERFFKNKQNYHDNVLKYISENRIDLLKGY
jgi:hypothetical protein